MGEKDFKQETLPEVYCPKWWSVWKLHCWNTHSAVKRRIMRYKVDFNTAFIYTSTTVRLYAALLKCLRPECHFKVLTDIAQYTFLNNDSIFNVSPSKIIYFFNVFFSSTSQQKWFPFVKNKSRAVKMTPWTIPVSQVNHCKEPLEQRFQYGLRRNGQLSLLVCCSQCVAASGCSPYLVHLVQSKWLSALSAILWGHFWLSCCCCCCCCWCRTACEVSQRVSMVVIFLTASESDMLLLSLSSRWLQRLKQ